MQGNYGTNIDLLICEHLVGGDTALQQQKENKVGRVIIRVQAKK